MNGKVPAYYLTKPQGDDKPTLYYQGGGVWGPVLSNRFSARFYFKESLAKAVQENNPGSITHEALVEVPNG